MISKRAVVNQDVRVGDIDISNGEEVQVISEKIYGTVTGKKSFTGYLVKYEENDPVFLSDKFLEIMK